MTTISTPSRAKNLLEDALQEADYCADRAVGKDLPSVSVIRHEHYHWGYSPFYYGSNCYTPCATSRKSSNSSQNENLVLLAIAATIAALAAIFSFGKTQGHLNETNQRIEAMKKRQADLHTELGSRADLKPLRPKMDEIFDQQEQVLSLQKEIATTDLAYKKTFALSSGLAGVGALAELSGAAAAATGFGTAAMFTGGALFIGTGAAWLYQKGVGSSETTLRLEAEKLKESVQNARRDLPVV